MRPKPYPGEDCFRCSEPIEPSLDGKKYIYCAECRKAIRQERVREEIDALEWPEVVSV